MSTRDITVYTNNLHEFNLTQEFLVDIIERYIYENNRIVLLIDRHSPTLFLNIKATLWYYNGYSYPHLNSEDSLASESQIVITQDLDYVLNNEFNVVISIYYSIDNINALHLAEKSKHLFIIDNDSSIKEFANFCLKSNVIFKYYQKSKASYSNSMSEQNANNKSDNITKNNKINKMKFFNNNEQEYEVKQDRAIVIIKPRVLKIKQEFFLMNRLLEQGLLVIKYNRKKVSKETWMEFYAHLSDKPFFDGYCEYMSSEFVGIVTIYFRSDRNDIFNKIRNLVGPTDPAQCKPYNLRYQFGLDINDNGIHASDSHDSFLRESEILSKMSKY